MASNAFNNALQKILAAYLVSGADIRIALVMTNTTCDIDKDAINFVANITTLDECDASGYARIALGSEASNVDDVNDRAEFDGTDISFTGLGTGTRAYLGILVFKFVTDDTDSVPLFFIDFPTDVANTSSQVDVTFNVEGIAQLSQAV